MTTFNLTRFMMVGALGTMFPLAAMAQSATPSDAIGSDEVVVTAQKRETALATTPLSISVIGAAEIEATQLQSVEGLSTQAPGLIFGETAGYPQIALRGIGTEISGITSDGGVTLNIDGVYVARLTGAGALFDDLQRIEVLRGPQGTLYGRNATGGAINILTKGPTSDFEGQASLLYGSNERVKATAAFSGPIAGDAVRGRLSLFTDQRGAAYHNIFTNQDIGDLEAYAIRGVVVTEFNPQFNVTWRAEWNKDKSDGFIEENQVEISVVDPASGNFGVTPSTPGGIFQAGLNLTPSLPLPRNNKDVVLNAPTSLSHETLAASATAEWDINDTLTLRSITAYRHTEFGRTADVDGSSAQILSEDYNRERSKQFTQEFNLLGTFGERSDWILGAFYLHDEATNYDLYSFTALARVIERATEIGLSQPIGSLAGTVPDELLFDDEQTTESYAVFGQVNYGVTEKLNLTGGLRYTRDEKDFEQTLLALGATQCLDARFNKAWESTTWRIGADYKVNDNVFTYASASEGFKSGGFNLGACNNPFDPENVRAYEAGVKNRLLDGKLSFNVTGFYYDYSDLQANIYTIGGGTVQNAADAKIYGAEFELQARPIEGLFLSANLALLHSEFVDFIATDPYNPLAGAQDVSGNHLQRAPEITGNGIAAYTWQTGSGETTLRYEVFHSDGYFNNVHNTADTRQPAYTLHNLRASYTQGSWEFGAYGENLGDEIYTVMRLPIGGVGGTVGSYGEARTFGVYTRVNF